MYKHCRWECNQDGKVERKGKKKKEIRTLGHNRFIFSLRQHHNPLPLCVDFGQSLRFLGNFLNVLRLQGKKQTLKHMAAEYTEYTKPTHLKVLLVSKRRCLLWDKEMRVFTEPPQPADKRSLEIGLTVSLPNSTSTYGRTCMRLSLKNWQMKGADRFRQKSLLLSDACFATFSIDSTETVRKKPCRHKVTFHFRRDLLLQKKQNPPKKKWPRGHTQAATYSNIIDFSFFHQCPVFLQIKMFFLLITISSS